MRKGFCIVFTVIILALLSANSFSNAEGRLEKRIDRCAIVLNEIMQMPESSIPQSLLSESSAIAIFPGTLKGGFIWGGRFGQGIIIARDNETGGWSPPAFFTIGEVSWGLQIGGQSIDIVLVIIGPNALDGFLTDNFTLGGDASIAAGPIGRDVEINSDLLLKGGMFSYSRAKGIFAGVSVKGAVITPNNVANRAYYGKDLTPREILVDMKVSVPDSAKELIETITKYSK